MADNEPTGDATSSVTPHRLYAEFEIRPSEAVDCHTDTTVTAEKTDAVDKTDAATGDDDPDQTGIVHSKTQLDAMCHCPVFLDYDCIPQTTAFNEDHLIVETYLPDREVLTELIEALKDVTAGVSLRRLTRIDDADTEQSNTVTLELYDLTDKQREAATKAVAAGYYQTPRETTVGELAADLGISKSAMSQRLNAVESKLAVSAFR